MHTNQRDGQMAYSVDDSGANPHVNYEPSITGGLREAQYPTHDEQGPEIVGRLTRKRIPRTDDYTQAGQRYLLSEQWEKDDLVANLTGRSRQCDRPIQERMVWHLLMCEDELACGSARASASGRTTCATSSRWPTQTLTDAELERAANLGKNGPRDVSGLTMTHCVPNEHVTVTR